MKPLTENDLAVPASLLKEVPARVALHYSVVPIGEEEGSLRLAVPQDCSWEVKEEIRILLGRPVLFFPESKPRIEAAIEKVYGIGAGMIETLAGRAEESGVREDCQILDADPKADPTVTRLVNELIRDAFKSRASDIHFEPFDRHFRIRYRVDGVLQEAKVSEKIKSLAPNLISRIKIMAKLDIAERRLPQDGRIQVRQKENDYDLRVSVLPSSFGEAVVIRILKPLDLLDLEDLGYDPSALARIRTQIHKPHGIILVTGPTGSGKTTTLYACLRELNSLQRKIITIEDPVEYKLSGLIQMQIHEKIGFTFARALRSTLRHDPDCLMVGEIRDPETAGIAVRSALTGHLVFSTLHTNDAPSAVTRLIEMGIEPYLAASSVEMVIAQRLVRKVCVPCERCGHTGVFGRTVVYEIMPVSEAIREMILSKTPSSMIRKQAVEEGMLEMSECGKKKVRDGIVHFEELNRNLKFEKGKGL